MIKYQVRNAEDEIILTTETKYIALAKVKKMKTGQVHKYGMNGHELIVDIVDGKKYKENN
jgi:hypothetical protein